MKIDFDCIVVGAGPAGSTASYHLGKLGHSVLLLEKQSLPRYKPCGGGVSPEIQKWFDFDFTPVISAKVNTFRCSWQMESSLDGLIDDNFEPLWMVRREKFDYFIVEKAVEQGVELVDNSGVTGVEFSNGIWSVKTRNKCFTCRYLIAADGSGGPMAKFLGFKERKYCKYQALEVEVPQDNLNESIVHLDFGSLDKGYAWNFPKSDGFSIGLGGVHKKMKPLLRDYMANQFQIDLDQHRIFGHTINAWNGNHRLHTTQALLVGEAACVVDPLTAEGIRPSMYSGLKAAEAIDQALSGKHNSLAGYSRVIHEEIGKEMFWASLLSKFFYFTPKVAYEAVVSQPSATNTMGQIMNGQLKYSEAFGKASRKVFKHYGSKILSPFLQPQGSN